jgi:hypothetical protein
MAVIHVRSLRRSTGHDWGAPLLDPLGIFYITLGVVYALLVFAGLFTLWLNRNKTAVRLRNFWIISSAVMLLLTYGFWVIIVYPLNGLFKCSVEFWVMSVFFPTSIAMFQGMAHLPQRFHLLNPVASNIRLLSYHEAQQELADDVSTLAEKKKKKRARLVKEGPYAVWKRLDTAKKTYCGIAVGLVIQVVVTFILFYGSRRFGKNGFFGQRVGPEECRRGYEW